MPAPRGTATKKPKGYSKKLRDKAAAKPEASKNLKKIIQKEIAKTAESKMVQYYNYSRDLVTPVDSGTFVTNNIFPVGVDPSSITIPQGVGQGNRLGNAVTTRKLMFKGTFCPKAYDINFNALPIPVQLKMWIFYDKRTPIDVPSPMSNFFQLGNATKGFQSDLVDMWSPVNRDIYTVLATRNFKLGCANNSGTGGLAAYQYFSNNDFSLNCNFSIDLTKHYIKTLKFNDASSVPTTRGLFCMVTYAAASGGLFPLGTTAVNLQYMLSYEFDDM